MAARLGAPADAVYAWGPTVYAEPLPAGMKVSLNQADAVKVFAANAAEAPERAGSTPDAHLWLYTFVGMGIVDRPSWVLQFRNVHTYFPSGLKGSDEHWGCTQSYVVAADTGTPLVDGINCPP